MGSKEYYKSVLGFVERSWPTLFETDVQKVSDRDCEQWLAGFQKANAPSVVNNANGVLRAVFQEAIGAGARFNNPAGGLSRTKVRGKRLELPSGGEFLRFVETVRTDGARQSKDCANLVRFLAYSGERLASSVIFTLTFAPRGDLIVSTQHEQKS